MDDLVWRASATGALGNAVQFLSFADRIGASAVCRSFREAVIGCFRSETALSTASFGSPATAITVSRWIAARVLPWPRLQTLHVNLELDAGAAYSSLLLALDAGQLRDVTLQGLCRRAEVVEALTERCSGVRTLRFQLRGHRGHSPKFAALLARCVSLEELDARDCPFSDDRLLKALAAGQRRAKAGPAPAPHTATESGRNGSAEAAAAAGEAATPTASTASGLAAAAGAAAAPADAAMVTPPAVAAPAVVTAAAAGAADGAAALSGSGAATSADAAEPTPAEPTPAGPLRRLVLGKCLHATSAGIEAVAAACPRLEALSLRGSPGVGARALEALAASPCAGASLRVLELPATRVGDAGVSAAAASMPRLTSLDLSAVRGLANAGLEALAVAPCLPGLERLGLGGLGPDASPAALGAVLRGAKGVRALELAANRYAVTDDVIDTVGQSCPLLETLLLRGCGSVTDAGLAALAAGRCAREGLRVLDLEFCVGIGDAGVVALADGCAGLEALSLRALAMAQVSLGAIRRVFDSNPGLVRLSLGLSGDPSTLQSFAAELGAARPGMQIGW